MICRVLQKEPREQAFTRPRPAGFGTLGATRLGNREIAVDRWEANVKTQPTVRGRSAAVKRDGRAPVAQRMATAYK